MPERLAVRARGVSKSFGEVVALDGVDLDIAEGRVHGLVGPDGAGKTTLLGLLLGLAKADGGDLEILGSLRQGRFPRRGPGTGQRLAVCRDVAPPGGHGDRLGHLSDQLDVTPDGRYVADGDGPQQVNGFFQVHTSTGDAPNPLWQFDGIVDLSTTRSSPAE